MEIADHVDALRRDGARLAEVADRAGLDAAVPTCPDWRVADLLRHLGGVHRWAASFVVTGRSRGTTPEETAELFAAPGDDELLGWFRAGHEALVAALAGADPSTACWTFLPAPTPLAFWARRQAHETAIHRVDAEAAASEVTGCAPGFAADGIDELLNGFLSRSRGRLVADPPVSLAVRATDVDAAWTMHIEPDRRRVAAGAHPADATVAGSASDLYLFLWNRADATTLDVQGDRAVLALWRSRATI
ncbi:MAG TPA: maleylpyruvate isomerase family mycothiol-dependent enzyme [Pilimelia sp.]|nr:maleylpyruvate isomerase family mycothiol-dependent enzyme [Pilimelia sp.]